MQTNGFHLTYCTNIHPGESWEATFENLKKYIPRIQSEVSPVTPFGIGLRLSDEASRSLLEEDHLEVFKNWLEEHHCYVFTMNGFPFGGFHRQEVKDQVHHPDWTTEARVEYTLRLFDILETLLPEGVEGGISTSPLSYRFWEATQNDREGVLQIATLNIAKIAARLYQIQQQHGKLLHLDIEPEPDGLLENTAEVIDWYRNWLLPHGSAYLKEQLGLSNEEAEACLKRHIRLCYDVCHFAIEYETPKKVFSQLKKEGIKIGKIQISAALRARLSEKLEEREAIRQALNSFVESTYLHQVVQRDANGQLRGYPDLPKALENLDTPEAREWRIHFHVPVFVSDYGQLESTQEDILEVLRTLKEEKVTDHLEVETYTWEVLPDDIQLEITDSIVRELQWVQNNL